MTEPAALDVDAARELIATRPTTALTPEQSHLADAIAEVARLRTTVAEPHRPSITCDPRIQFGRPCVTGTRVTADTVAEHVWAGEGPDEVTRDFDIDRLDVLWCCAWWVDASTAPGSGSGSGSGGGGAYGANGPSTPASSSAGTGPVWSCATPTTTSRDRAATSNTRAAILTGAGAEPEERRTMLRTHVVWWLHPGVNVTPAMQCACGNANRPRWRHTLRQCWRDTSR